MQYTQEMAINYADKLTELVNHVIDYGEDTLTIIADLYDDPRMIIEGLTFDGIKHINFDKTKYNLLPEFYLMFPNLESITVEFISLECDKIIIRDLPKLTHITMNPLDKRYTIKLMNLPSLTSLNTRCVVEQPTNLINFPLSQIIIYNNQLLKRLLCMKNIRYLRIYDCDLLKIPNELRFLKNLKQLKIDHCMGPILEDISSLSYMKGLIELRISDTDINGNILKPISDLDSLQILEMENCRSLALVFPDDIDRLSNLKTFSVINCYLHLPPTFKNLHSLTKCVLDRSSINCLDEEMFSQPKLSYLSLIRFKLMSRKQLILPRILSRSLETLIIRIANRITIPHLLSYSNLVKLNITNDGYTQTPIKFPPLKLQTLETIELDRLNIKGINNIKCSTLTSVKFTVCIMNEFPMFILQNKDITDLYLDIRGVTIVPIDIDELQNLKEFVLIMRNVKSSSIIQYPLTLANLKNAKITLGTENSYGDLMSKMASIDLDGVIFDGDLRDCLLFWSFMYRLHKYILMPFSNRKKTNSEIHEENILSAVIMSGLFSIPFKIYILKITVEITRNCKSLLQFGVDLQRLIIIILLECVCNPTLQGRFVEQSIPVDEDWLFNVKDWLVSEDLVTNDTRHYVRANKLQQALDLLFQLDTVNNIKKH